MLLTPHEQERLMLSYAADLAWRRRERGLRLNYPEAVAILCAFVLEAARDGRGVEELMQAGREVLSVDDVMDGVPAMLPEVQIEATFPDGTKLVTIHDPFRASGPTGVSPGEVIAAEGAIELNAGAPRTIVRVVNTGDRPVQVGSHFHLAQANPALAFDRRAAWGRRLDIPAGTAVRFEPGIARDVTLVPIAGARLVPGLSLDPPGALDIPTADEEG